MVSCRDSDENSLPGPVYHEDTMENEIEVDEEEQEQEEEQKRTGEQNEKEGGDVEDQEEEEDEEESLYQSKTVMRDVRVRSSNDPWITAEARPGDVLIITLEKITRAATLVKEIRSYDEFYRENDQFLYPNCFVRNQRIEYRDEVRMFERDSELFQIRIMMGGETYSLGEIVKHEGSRVTTAFGVIEEMMDENLDFTSTFFYLLPSPERLSTVGRISFVNRKFCPKSFNLDYRDRKYDLHETEYDVTVILKTMRENSWREI